MTHVDVVSGALRGMYRTQEPLLLRIAVIQGRVPTFGRSPQGCGVGLSFGSTETNCIERSENYSTSLLSSNIDTNSLNAHIFSIISLFELQSLILYLGKRNGLIIVQVQEN